MFLVDYPPGYIPKVKEIHPVLQDQYAALHKVLESPVGLLSEYPYLGTMLAHNLAFLGRRPIMLAHNLSEGPNTLIDLLHYEAKEFQAETPLVKTEMPWEYVDGKASSEAVDLLFFGGLLAGVVESGIGRLNETDLLSMHLALQQINQVKAKSPQFDPFADFHVRKVVHPEEGKNPKNYPEGATQAPLGWDIPTMTRHYKNRIKPGLRTLRDSFGGVLPAEVAAAINLHQRDIPQAFANPVTSAQYEVIYQAAHHGN